MSSLTAEPSRGLGFPRAKRWGIRLLVVIGAVIVLRYALRAFVSIDTNLLWFRSVQHESVYTRTFWTQVVLFVIFGVLMAAAVAASLIVTHRYRPAFAPHPVKQRWRYRFAANERRLRWWLFVVIVGYFGITMGARAGRNWQAWLLWRDAQSFHQTDPQFHRDYSYYLFVYPFHRLVLTLLFRIVATALIAIVVTAYAYGGLRIRGTGPRMTRAVKAELSLVLGCYLVLKALAYWLDRYAQVTSSRGVVTGVSYTVVNAVLPGKIVLIVIAGVSAVVLFANVAFRTTKLLVIGLAVMAGGAFVFGYAWPGIVQHFRERPSASRLELPYIAHNMTNTRQAFGLSANTLTTQTYDGSDPLTGRGLAAQAARNAQIRLLDPNQLSPTFTIQQQKEAYYGFKSTLDIDRYPLDGSASQDVAIAVRELNVSNIARKSWANVHLVYTHGYGVVAAPTDNLDTSGGTPDYVDGGIPLTDEIPVTTPQIYYGQMSPSYSIVGQPAGSTTNLEVDHPSDTGATQQSDYTHVGGGGVPIGSIFHRLLYAYKLHSSGVLFSSEINSASQLLTVRNPRARVAAVAPWLTLDGDVYPTIVNGRVLWVVDGYTTSNSYPDSQQINLRGATSSTLSRSGSTVTQPSTSVNYMQNSVKATVDAYSGKVTLYAWNQAPSAATPDPQPDPVLATWEKAFPGLVQSQADIPAALLPHLRYPQDLFGVQRSLLTRYHVSSPSQLYNGSDFWTIPNDPTAGAGSRVNAVGQTVSTGTPTLPSTYMSLSATGGSAARFSLSTPMVTLNSRNLAAFLSVDSVPGPDYGKFTLLAMPAGQSLPSPSQVQSEIEADPTAVKQLTLLRGGNSKVVIGNLLTIPLGGQMLYVEPIYTEAKSGVSYPKLQRVAALYGNGTPAYKDTLSAALATVLGVTPQAGTESPVAPTP
jgi:uncharacterized protein